MDRIGPYRILGTIALGGMGEVFLAALQREGGFEKRVALKRALPELTANPSFVELFEREARLAAALQHRNIVQVFDFGRHENGAWIAMEYVHGVDLKAVLDQESALPPALAVEVVHACARGLAYAHTATDARGRALHVVHRDVSPQNVLLSFQGDVKLADFGLAHAVEADASEPRLGLHGKYAYMSPEQARGSGVGPAGDQFSLAVVLYEVLTGERAFFGDDGVEAILERVRAAALRVPVADADLPPSLAPVLERALSRDVDDRFPDAAAFADALRAASIGLPPTDAPLGDWLATRFPDRVQGNLAASALLTPLEPTAAADVPITSAPPTASPEVTAVAAAPITHEIPQSVSPFADTVAPLEPPSTAELDAGGSPSRAPLALLLVALFAVGAWATLRPSNPAPGAESAQQALDSGRSDHWGGPRRHVPVGTVDAADSSPPQPDAAAKPDATAPDAAKPDAAKPDAAKPDAAAVAKAPPRPTPPRVKPRKSPVRAAPSDDSAQQPANSGRSDHWGGPRPHVSVGTVDTPDAGPRLTASPERAPAPGPRLKISAVGAAVTGGRVIDGWRPLPSSAQLLRVTGGPGPPVFIRVRWNRTRMVAQVDAKPWGEITHNGNGLGTTPIAHVAMSEGRHRLEVRGPDGATTSVRLEVQP